MLRTTIKVSVILSYLVCQVRILVIPTLRVAAMKNQIIQMWCLLFSQTSILLHFVTEAHFLSQVPFIYSVITVVGVFPCALILCDLIIMPILQTRKLSL